ncbi:MAG: M20/M25/M40 family metallo-hydrolase [Sphingomonas sp.]
MHFGRRTGSRPASRPTSHRHDADHGAGPQSQPGPPDRAGAHRRIGGRLTNSPSMRKAESWAMDKYKGWGLSNIRRDPFVFGRGWYFTNASISMTAPRLVHMTAIPVAWTPGTNGTIKAEIVVAPMARVKDFDAWKGKLKGKIVLVSLPGTGSEPDKAPFQRYTAEDIKKMDTYDLPNYDPDSVERAATRRSFEKRLDEFLVSEGALGWAKISARDGGLVHGTGYNYRVGHSPALPAFEIAAEDYRRLARLAKVGPAPVVEMASDARFDDSDVNAYNIIAEIPGSDPKAGYVMAGAHLDSWVAADGAVDNGAGSAMIMEAARILQATGAKPKRTIRFVLWAGEEQGAARQPGLCREISGEPPGGRAQ